MTDRTPLEMLELLVHSIELSTEEAQRTTQPLKMVYHADSIIVQEAKRVIKHAHS